MRAGCSSIAATGFADEPGQRKGYTGDDLENSSFTRAQNASEPRPKPKKKPRRETGPSQEVKYKVPIGNHP
jgi:hypothetical protein